MAKMPKRVVWKRGYCRRLRAVEQAVPVGEVVVREWPVELRDGRSVAGEWLTRLEI